MKRICYALALLMIVSPVAAQQTCGHGIPCGPIPWSLPNLPNLSSPSPFPTIEFTATYTPSATPTASDTPEASPTFTPSSTSPYTPVPSPTPFMDTTEIWSHVETLEAVLVSTPAGINNPEGTPVNIDDIADALAGDAGNLFDYIQGLTLANFGVLTPLIIFMITGFLFTLTFKLATLILPMAVLMFGFLRKIIQFLLDFIPG